MYTLEFLNTLKLSGIPNLSLELKVGMPIILMKNPNHSVGLCNGTQLIIVQLGERVIEAKIITSNNIGERVYIPLIVMSPIKTKLPFTFKRRQFSVRLEFALINKSQGTSNIRKGWFLPIKTILYSWTTLCSNINSDVKVKVKDFIIR